MYLPFFGLISGRLSQAFFADSDTFNGIISFDYRACMETFDHLFLNEEFTSLSVKPTELDELLARGWRHFGTEFFRYNLAWHDFEIRRVHPLRIRLTGFSLSKSQRRILKKNTDCRVVIQPANVNPPTIELFDRHRLRFVENRPDSLYQFLSDDPSRKPCSTFEVAVYKESKLIAVSFFDLGSNSLSGVYAVFDPQYANRSLGIFTMLTEIDYAISSGKQFYYQGYCYDGESFYDYKKKFRGSEYFDWKDSWRKLNI